MRRHHPQATRTQGPPKDAIHRAPPPPDRLLKSRLVEGHVERVFDAHGTGELPTKTSVREARAAFLDRLARKPESSEALAQ
jgi:hypothetical protein